MVKIVKYCKIVRGDHKAKIKRIKQANCFSAQIQSYRLSKKRENLSKLNAVFEISMNPIPITKHEQIQNEIYSKNKTEKIISHFSPVFTLFCFCINLNRFTLPSHFCNNKQSQIHLNVPKMIKSCDMKESKREKAPEKKIYLHNHYQLRVR